LSQRKHVVRKGNVLVLVVAVVMGLAAAWMAREWVSRQVVAAPTPVNAIVVATAKIGFGTELTRDNVTEIPWAAAKIPDGAFGTKDELFRDGRRVVLTPMDRSELILSSKITGPGQRASLSALLEPGHKAVTVRVDDVRGVAGFVLPGDRVDVVLIRESRTNNSIENSSDVLVQHVKVLAVDQLVNERQEHATVAKAVTLEVTTEQAQKILLAVNVGRLSLILRQAGPAEAETAQRITDADLGIPQKRVATPPAAVVPEPLGSVDVVRGMRRESYNVHRSKVQ
jgi:pilus assembly protein CpaB